MTIRPMLSETLLIEKIRRAIPSRPGRGLLLGIGDDAAVIHGSRQGKSTRTKQTDWVLSSDSFQESRHFLINRHPPQSVGYKALARAISDMAAMGAVPRVFLLNLSLPRNRSGFWLDRFLEGMARAARRFHVVLAGGDVSSFPFVAVSITVLGEVPKGMAIKRSGAQPGDMLFVTGVLGAAQMGLQTILATRKRPSALLRSIFLRPHLFPVPRLGLGQWLADEGLASAMIDISDGFSTDLCHLCAASQVGALVFADHIPCVCLLRKSRRKNHSRLELALHGGDDYELLFTVPLHLSHRVPSTFHGLRITQVGEIVRRREIRLLDATGRSSKLWPRGWDHFR